MPKKAALRAAVFRLLTENIMGVVFKHPPQRGAGYLTKRLCVLREKHVDAIADSLSSLVQKLFLKEYRHLPPVTTILTIFDLCRLNR